MPSWWTLCKMPLSTHCGNVSNSAPSMSTCIFSCNTFCDQKYVNLKVEDFPQMVTIPIEQVAQGVQPQTPSCRHTHLKTWKFVNHKKGVRCKVAQHIKLRLYLSVTLVSLHSNWLKKEPLFKIDGCYLVEENLIATLERIVNAWIVAVHLNSGSSLVVHVFNPTRASSHA